MTTKTAEPHPSWYVADRHVREVARELRQMHYPVLSALKMVWPDGGPVIALYWQFWVEGLRPYDKLILISPVDVTAADVAARYHRELLSRAMLML